MTRPPAAVQSVFATSLAYGVYMATSSNIRYQVRPHGTLLWPQRLHPAGSQKKGSEGKKKQGCALLGRPRLETFKPARHTFWVPPAGPPPGSQFLIGRLRAERCLDSPASFLSASYVAAKPRRRPEG
jgi:hypothetical protein